MSSDNNSKCMQISWADNTRTSMNIIDYVKESDIRKTVVTRVISVFIAPEACTFTHIQVLGRVESI